MKIWVSDEFEGNAWIHAWMKPDIGSRFRWVFMQPYDDQVAVSGEFQRLHASAVPCGCREEFTRWVEEATYKKTKVLLTPDEVERYIKWH